MHRTTPEHALMRSICRLAGSENKVQGIVSSVITFVLGSSNVAVSCALCTLLVRRAAQLPSRGTINAADIATVVLQHMQNRWGKNPRLGQLTGEAQEIISKSRDLSVAALRQLSANSGEWDRVQMATAIGLLPSHIDATPCRYVASVERRPPADDGSGQHLVVADSLPISMRDPLSLRPILVPARGKSCTHVQPFDLDSFLQTAERSFKSVPATGDQGPKSSGLAKCPVCSEPLKLEDLYVDRFLRDNFIKVSTSTASKALRLTLRVATGAMEVVAEDRGDATEEAKKGQPLSPAVKSPPPAQTPPQKRPREMEIEGHLLTFEEDD